MRRDWGRRIGAERYYGARRRYGAGRYAFDVPSRPAAADRLVSPLNCWWTFFSPPVDRNVSVLYLVFLFGILHFIRFCLFV